MKKFAFAAAALGALLSAAPASAATVVSENFDAGFGVFSVESTTIDRNTARPGYQICCGATGSDAALDNPFVAFGSGNVTNRGSILTEFQTQAGLVYTLTFRAGAFGGGSTNLTYNLGAISNTLTLLADNNVDTTFRTYTASFVGLGTPVGLSFSSRGEGTNVDAILDDVAVTSVPEPASWAMMMLGFGMAGFGLRRRRKGAVTARVGFA